MKYYTREAFIAKYYPFVKNITKATGIFPEILLSQAIIESQGPVNGRFYVGASKLASQYNNYFGIKAGKGWTGPSVKMKTGEIINNSPVTITDAFRVYTTPEESFRDYIQFLKNNPRYTNAGVFEADNYRDQAERIAAAGYATGKDYAELISQVATKTKQYIEDNLRAGNFSPDSFGIAAAAFLFFF